MVLQQLYPPVRAGATKAEPVGYDLGRLLRCGKRRNGNLDESPDEHLGRLIEKGRLSFESF
jgi:hypothetical protein